MFPSLLLATTLARLVLNVATTRLILTRAGSDGVNAAGHVVASFAEFVAGDKIVVGIIIFVIIVVIQFVVITKGATRISEVAARFALDGMPGKQMAIDADLNAGIIDEREAQSRRERDHAAGRFLRGDGRCQQVRPRRRDRRHHHHGDQHRGRADHRHGRVRHAAGRGGQGFHAADDRRRPGEPGAGVLDFAGGRLARDAQHAEVEHAAGVHAADLLAAAGAGGDGRVPGDSGVHELAARAAAGARRRVPGLGADDDAARIARRRSRRRSRPSETRRRSSRRSGSRIISRSIRWRSSWAWG